MPYFQYEASIAWEAGLTHGMAMLKWYTTRVSYTAPVRASFNEVRMTP